ncbi:putative cell wall protein [Rosellinia necatrix]|uniref:Putative cell wall protein n=1 Tax=Rosellinia necatrix TaxID=77044 RepID=A0A1S7UII9_ROSNE|nr:putative cell wall protein [Rosellinia necatrix]
MYTNALSLALFAGAAMASPCTTTPRDTSAIAAGDRFTLLSLRSASAVHFGQVSAALNSVFVNLPAQNATCDDGAAPTQPGYATFTLSEAGELYLYAASATPQQLYADRSGMGQGKLGYTTGAEPAPRNAERAGFAVGADGALTLAGAGFLACPDSVDGAWSVWVDAGVANPAGNTGCLGFSARAVKVEGTPNSCLYTQ